MLLTVELVAHLAVRVDRINLCTGGDFGTEPGGGSGKGSADRAHATDRDVPIAGATAE